ncbi:hypothetical protein ABPG75_009166 [Micractinium tetrahymenae]
MPLRDRPGLRFATPLTLLHLLAGLGPRVQRLLPPGTATWRQLAEALTRLCGIGDMWRLQLRALCCWALQPARGGAADRPLLAGGGGPASGGSLARHMHTFSVMGFDARAQELCFLLPPDHGMEPSAAAVALVDGVSMGQLTTSAVPLAGFRVEPFDQPPPPALAAGLRRLLEQSMAAADAAEGGSSKKAPAGAAGAAGAAGTQTPASASPGLRLCPGLQLRQLAEHADRYELELGVEQRLGGSRSSSGLELGFPGAVPGGAACQKLELSLAQPARLRARIALPWPFDSREVGVKVRKSARTVAVTLPKFLPWPAAGPSVDADRLPEWGRGPAEARQLSMYMSLMFSHQEMEHRQRQNARPGQMGTLFELKESLQALFVMCYQQGIRVHTVYRAPARPEDEPALTIFIHGGVRRLPDGRPLLQLSAVDHGRAAQLYPSPASRAAPFARFSRMMRQHGGGQSNNLGCSPAEIRLRKALLDANAATLRVPSWQASVLELPSDWTASFLVPLYSDVVAGPEQGASLMEEFARKAGLGGAASGNGGAGTGGAGSRAGSSMPGSSGASSAGGGSRTAAARGGSTSLAEVASASKEAGNAAFRQRQYDRAAELYGKGLAMLGAPSGASGVALRVDLANNLALAFLKQAEGQPSDAPSLLGMAEGACSAALSSDPRNGKALYRRALARHRQGKHAEAAADLATIPPAEPADAAVAALRAQVEAALRKG